MQVANFGAAIDTLIDQDVVHITGRVISAEGIDKDLH